MLSDKTHLANSGEMFSKVTQRCPTILWASSLASQAEVDYTGSAACKPVWYILNGVWREQEMFAHKCVWAKHIVLRSFL